MITGFLLKKPDSKRRTFQIIPYRRLNGKKVYFHPIEDSTLATINTSIKTGLLTNAQAESEIKLKLLPELKRRAKIPLQVAAESQVSENNLKVYKAFWNEYYRRKRLECREPASSEFL